MSSSSPGSGATAGRRRIRRSTLGRGNSSWADVFFAIGIVFLLLAVAVYVLLLLNPFIAAPQSWNPALDVLAGAFGLILIGLGFWHRHTERRG